MKIKFGYYWVHISPGQDTINILDRKEARVPVFFVQNVAEATELIRTIKAALTEDGGKRVQFSNLELSVRRKLLVNKQGRLSWGGGDLEIAPSSHQWCHLIGQPE